MKRESLGILRTPSNSQLLMASKEEKKTSFSFLVFEQVLLNSFFFLYFKLLTLYFKAGLGFLTDDRRLNVALTRAKYAVVVIGKDDLLARDKMWKAVMDYAKSKGSYVKSSINTGKRSSYEGRAPPPPGKVVNRDGQFFRRDDLERNAA